MSLKVIERGVGGRVLTNDLGILKFLKPMSLTSTTQSLFRSASHLKEWHLALPLTGFLLVFYIIPVLLMVGVSLSTEEQFDGISLAQYVNFVSDAFNLKVLLDTLWLGVQTATICLLLGYPLAYTYTRTARGWWRSLLTFLIILPLLTSAVVRTFAWVVILGKQGIINSTLISLGWIEQPLNLLFTHRGVVAALSQIQMPLMVLPIIASMARIDPNLEQASASLGGNKWRTFWRITLPLSLPGIISGCLLVFATSVSSFITPSVIGGGRLLYMPMYIYQQAVSLLKFPFAAAISVILLITVLAVVVIFSWLGQISQSYSHTS